MKGRILFPFLLMSLFLNISCDKEEQKDKNGYDIARVYTDIAFSLQLDYLKNFTMTSGYHGLMVDVKSTSDKDILELITNDQKFSASIREIRNYVDRLPESLNSKTNFKFGFLFVPYVLDFVDYP